jgi:thioredoxin 1
MQIEEFNKTINSGKTVLVDFYANWCGPCRLLSPKIENLKEKYSTSDDIEILKIDVDASPDITKKYGIRSIPTMKIFKEGEVSSTLVGIKSEEEIENEIKK